MGVEQRGTNLTRGLGGILLGLAVIATLFAGVLLSLMDSGASSSAGMATGVSPTGGPMPTSLMEQILITLPPPAEIPTPAPSATPTPTRVPVLSFALYPPTPEPCIPPAGWRAETLASGDSLLATSLRERLSVELLIAANCIVQASLFQGDQLYLPPEPLPTPQPCSVPLSWVLYTVQPGDTMFSLARSRGVTVYDVLQANCRTSTWLYAGNGLYLPPSGAAGPVSTPLPTGAAGTWPTATPQPAATPTVPTWTIPTLLSPVDLACDVNTTFQHFAWSSPLPLPAGWNFEVRVLDAHGGFYTLRTQDRLSIDGLPWLVYLDRADSSWRQPYWELAVLDATGRAVVGARYTPFLSCP